MLSGTERDELILSARKLVGFIARKGRQKYRLDYEDVEQECWLEVIKHADKFDPTFGVKFVTCVEKRLQGLLIDIVRKRMGRWRRVAETISLTEFKGKIPDKDHAGVDNNLYCDQLLSRLNERAREITILHLQFGYEQAELAKRLSISPGRVSQIVIHSRSRMIAESTD